jgi:hypothetical protein
MTTVSILATVFLAMLVFVATEHYLNVWEARYIKWRRRKKAEKFARRHDLSREKRHQESVECAAALGEHKVRRQQDLNDLPES